MPLRPSSFVVLPLVLLTVGVPGQDGRAEFFEKRIRPVLAEHCYRCHNSSGTKKKGLALDHRAALRRGGKSGPAIVVGRSGESLLVRAMRHVDDGLRMPDEGPKLSDAVIADFARWIDDGAVDPRDAPPTADELKATLSWETVRERRKKWWSFQPVGDPAIPAVKNADWSSHPVDRFVLARLEGKGLEPVARADRRVLIRRLTFALIGLPPTPAEVRAFVADDSPRAWEKLVDRLLASPHFGERWARHFMDWTRYADSHGSEGDPAIHHAWRYRDYLIRALNQDVAFDQLVREHIAGDRLAKPRINRELGIVESKIGTAQFRFVQHGFAPTDALEEQVRFTENQIDVVSKAFLGLTVSCARCHDHKFDAIGQADFYAMYGIFASCRPAMITIDTPEKLATNKQSLATRKVEIKRGLADAWLDAIDSVSTRLSKVDDKVLAVLVAKAAKNDKNPLHALARVRGATEFAKTWRELTDAWRRSRERLERQRSMKYAREWDLSGDDYRRWFRYGVGLGDRPSAPGEFHVLPAGDRVVTSILPGGVYSHLLSSKHNGVLSSPRFEFGMKSIYVRVMGDGGSKARYAVQSYPRGGTVYPIHTMRGGESRWVRWDGTYWRGDHGYLEISTAADQAVEVNPGATRSWFGITRAVFVSDEQAKRGEVPRDEAAEFVTPLFAAAADSPPKTVADVGRLYGTALRGCVEAWREGTMTDEQARFLGFFVRSDLLPTRLEKLPELAKLVAAYRELEKGVPVPTRAPGMLEAEAFDQPMFVRGNHKKPGAPVPRRFLEAFGGAAYRSDHSGRLEFANDLVRGDNPLTPRVAVNRIWHHLFGRGIVATTDNFGHLGSEPTHPQLLDHMARRFVDSGWSVKKMIRSLVTSETFRLDSRRGGRGRGRVRELDPTNELLSRFRIRRLEAEAIRDSLLAVSGELDLAMYGPPVSGTSRRRSVYVRVKRNNLDPFLRTFDAPEPHTTRGVRESTNVPAQSLTLLNDPFVIGRAAAWADSLLKIEFLGGDRRRFEQMFESAFGRRPESRESGQAAEFLRSLAERGAQLERDVARVESEVAGARKQLAALTEPVRRRLLAAIDTGAVDAPKGPTPIASWEFDGDVRDSIGQLHGKLRGKARVAEGALILNGNGHVETAPLPKSLRAKTLEAWVVLRNLDQRGGGVMSVESVGGGVFDSIVFAERDARQWLPGSNHFARTQSLGGPVEADARKRPVHVAITYGRDGTVTAYRDGKRYGKPYRSKGPMTFAAGRSVVLFGLRHSPAVAGRYLRGRVLRARLYDRALTADEVGASSRGERRFVGEAQVLAAMSESQRRDLARIENRIAEFEKERAGMEAPTGYRFSPRKMWSDVAQSLFNLKEFVYVR